MHTRRDFLKSTGVLATMPLTSSLLVGSSAASSAALPTAGTGQFYVLLRGLGGMDATLGLDPWTASALPDPKDMFVEYRPDDVIALGSEVRLGPAAAILKGHAGDFSIINGVFMSQTDNGHPASVNYITAGSTAKGAPALPVELALSCVEGDFGVLTDTALDMGSRVVTTSNLSDLAQIANKTDITALLRLIFTDGAANTPYLESVRRVIRSRTAVRIFIKNLASFAPEPMTDAHVTAAAFMTDVASFAQIDLSANLDTHASHPGTHLTEQSKIWAQVDAIFKLFKKTPYGGSGQSLFERTTFMVACEFSRTPALNGSNGKDHNPLTNSVLLAGRGIQGGRVVGGSRLIQASESATGSSYHIALPLDFATGQTLRQRTPSAQMLFPDHVAQTIATVMNVDRNRFQSIGPSIPALQRLLV